jgi:hypothetical protein
VIRPGVARAVVTFDEEGLALAVNEGSMVVEVDDTPHSSADRLVWYTLDAERLQDLLRQAGAAESAVEATMFELDAAAMVSASLTADEEDDDMVAYWRTDLLKVLANHQRLWPDDPERDGCSCGRLRIGDSFGEHIADEYETEARG